jgi:hypothetical protein
MDKLSFHYVLSCVNNALFNSVRTYLNSTLTLATKSGVTCGAERPDHLRNDLKPYAQLLLVKNHFISVTTPALHLTQEQRNQNAPKSS